MTNKPKTRTFSDLDANFTLNPVTSDVSKIYDENDIKRSIKSLVFSDHYDHPFHPEIYSPINGLLFQNFTSDLGSIIKRLLTDLIVNYEPRVRVIDIIVNTAPEVHQLDIDIIFSILNSPNEITLSVLLKRHR